MSILAFYGKLRCIKPNSAIFVSLSFQLMKNQITQIRFRCVRIVPRQGTRSNEDVTSVGRATDALYYQGLRRETHARVPRKPKVQQNTEYHSHREWIARKTRSGTNHREHVQDPFVRKKESDTGADPLPRDKMGSIRRWRL